MSAHVVVYGSPMTACGPFKSHKRASRAAALLREAGTFAEVLDLSTWVDTALTHGIQRAPDAVRQARYQKERVMNGGKPWRLVDAIGTHRRIRALACLGWSTRALERKYDLPRWTLDSLLNHRTIHRGSYELVKRIYDELQTTAPVPTTKNEKIGISRAKGSARKGGWGPPASWDDIDDPEERPKGLRKVAA